MTSDINNSRSAQPRYMLYRTSLQKSNNSIKYDDDDDDDAEADLGDNDDESDQPNRYQIHQPEKRQQQSSKNNVTAPYYSIQKGKQQSKQSIQQSVVRGETKIPSPNISAKNSISRNGEATGIPKYTNYRNSLSEPNNSNDDVRSSTKIQSVSEEIDNILSKASAPSSSLPTPKKYSSSVTSNGERIRMTPSQNNGTSIKSSQRSSTTPLESAIASRFYPPHERRPSSIPRYNNYRSSLLNRSSLSVSTDTDSVENSVPSAKSNDQPLRQSLPTEEEQTKPQANIEPTVTELAKQQEFAQSVQQRPPTKLPSNASLDEEFMFVDGGRAMSTISSMNDSNSTGLDSVSVASNPSRYTKYRSTLLVSSSAASGVTKSSSSSVDPPGLTAKDIVEKPPDDPNYSSVRFISGVNGIYDNFGIVEIDTEHLNEKEQQQQQKSSSGPSSPTKSPKSENTDSNDRTTTGAILVAPVVAQSETIESGGEARIDDKSNNVPKTQSSTPKRQEVAAIAKRQEVSAVSITTAEISTSYRSIDSLSKSVSFGGDLRTTPHDNSTKSAAELSVRSASSGALDDRGGYSHDPYWEANPISIGLKAAMAEALDFDTLTEYEKQKTKSMFKLWDIVEQDRKIVKQQLAEANKKRLEQARQQSMANQVSFAVAPAGVPQQFQQHQQLYQQQQYIGMGNNNSVSKTTSSYSKDGDNVLQSTGNGYTQEPVQSPNIQSFDIEQGDGGVNLSFVGSGATTGSQFMSSRINSSTTNKNGPYDFIKNNITQPRVRYGVLFLLLVVVPLSIVLYFILKQ